MPKIHIQVSEDWWARRGRVIDQTISALIGLTAQIENHQINGEYDAEDLLDRLDSALRDIRRNMESIAIPF